MYSIYSKEIISRPKQQAVDYLYPIGVLKDKRRDLHLRLNYQKDILSKRNELVDLKIEGQGQILSQIKKIHKYVGKKPHLIEFERVKNPQITCKKIPIKVVGVPAKYRKRIFQGVDSVDSYGPEEKVPELLSLNISNIQENETITLGEIKPPEGIEFSESDLNRPVIFFID